MSVLQMKNGDLETRPGDSSVNPAQRLQLCLWPLCPQPVRFEELVAASAYGAPAQTRRSALRSFVSKT